MMLFKKVVLFFSLFCLVGLQVAHSQALLAPVENFVINRAEAAIITRVAIGRGFAANDPRIAATMTGMSESSAALNVASTGAALALGFLGAPVWLTIAAGLGILAAGTALVLHTASSSVPPPSGDSSVTISRSQDGTVISVQQPVPASVMDSYPAGTSAPAAPATPQEMMSPIAHGVMYQGAVIYSTPSCLSGDPCAAYPPLPSGQKNFTRNYAAEALVLKTLVDVQAYDTYEQQYNAAGGIVGQSGYDMGTGYDWVSTSVYFRPSADGSSATLWEDRVTKVRDSNGMPMLQPATQPASWWLVGPGVSPISGKDLAQIYPLLSDSAKKAPLDAITLATISNQTWQRASMLPDYQGLPYSISSPLTSADVQPWIDANPTAAPTLDDLFRPAANPGTSTVPISPTATPSTTPDTTPGTTPSTTPGTTPSTTPGTTPLCGVNGVVCTMNVNVNGDPNTPAPTLESAPTIEMILSPLLNLFPDLKAWAVPAHSGTCPSPNFEVFGHNFTLDQHCTLLEQHRSTISTIFMAVFALSALFIVLAA